MPAIEGIKTRSIHSIRGKAKGRNIAAIIKKHFPDVETVSDSLQAVAIRVTPRDQRGAEAACHTNCAFARAARRCLGATGAYIGIEISYVVFGKHAIRFVTPATVAREITSFDRHSDFAVGSYRLSPVPNSRRMGLRPRGGKTNRNAKPKLTRRGALVPMQNASTARIRFEEAHTE